MIKKIYTVLTVIMIAIILFHGIYMFLGLAKVVPFSDVLAAICGTVLTVFVALHGLYGLTKVVILLVQKKRRGEQIKRRQSQIKSGGVRATRIQRITGIIIFIMFVPHGFISMRTAPVILIVLDYLYLLSILFHLICGLPKLFVSMGITGNRLEKVFSRVYGGDK